MWINEKRPCGNEHQSYIDYKAAKCLFRKFHRDAVLEFITRTEEEIDTAAEMDSVEFWKLVN